MEFNEKLQELRKQRGLTQEELAQVLYVSRTAVSKWESGRGYPNIDSLKAIATFFDVSVDELLSGDQLLTVAAEETKVTTTRLRDLVFALLDLSTIVLLLLPLLGETVNDVIRVVYVVLVMVTTMFGVLTLVLQNCSHSFWVRTKSVLSMLLSVVGVLLFILSPQPYAAAILFVFLIVKVILWMTPIVSRR